MKPNVFIDLFSCVTLGIWVTMGSIHHKFLLGFFDSIIYKHCKCMLFSSLSFLWIWWTNPYDKWFFKFYVPKNFSNKIKFRWLVVDFGFVIVNGHEWYNNLTSLDRVVGGLWFGSLQYIWFDHSVSVFCVIIIGWHCSLFCKCNLNLLTMFFFSF
jgi:hypothetical protein